FYFFSDKRQFQDAIKEITLYFKEEQIVFTTDIEVAAIIFNIDNQETEFDEIKKHLNEYSISANNSLAFRRELKPYQIKGFEHLLNVKHGANFSVPGSGKTSVVYAYFDRLRQEGLVDKLFVVGPFSSFSPWEEEAQLCFGQRLNSARLVGLKRQSYYLQSSDYDLFLCHYQTAANDISDIIRLCQKHNIMMVIDESHYIKRFDGGVWANALITISPYAKRRIILSGTPMPNGFSDLWSQMTFLWPGKQLLGEKTTYKNRSENPNQREAIKKEIRPFFYRVKKSDLGLPEPRFYRTEYALNPIQSQIYQALSIKLLSDLKIQPEDKKQLRQWRKAKMIRLLQAASNPNLLSQYSEEFAIPPLSSDGLSIIKLVEKYSQYEMPSKFEAATKLVKELLSKGKKVILWTSFIHNIKMLESNLQGINYYTIHGAIPRDDKEDEAFNREKQIREFKSTNKPSLLIANPAACAESISLHKICHDAIYLDRTFNCGQYIQSLDRIHRIGLEKDEIVNYHILIAKNTIDETINRRIEEKFQTMIHVLEDEIPIGILDVEAHEMELTDSEEKLDFSETVKDIKAFIKG
ncbi:MAG TPA: DEAD/DEAH box helicase, partial [Mucilaginibacter sp.]